MNKKRILVAPLDWGIGHATRMVPIIRSLQHKEAEIILAADGISYQFLKNYFPELQLIRLKGFNISYSRNKLMFVPKMLLQIPKIISGIIREHKELQEIIKIHKIDAVISDNRYGLYSSKVRSIFITHQVFIKMPEGLSFMEPLLLRLNQYFFSKYNEIWVPDFPGEQNISGDLAHKKALPNIHFLGALSRFNEFKPIKADKKWDILVMLSGPEPQRSILEAMIIDQIKATSYKTIILQGKPEGKRTPPPSSNILILPHASDEDIYTYIMQSKHIICRSGYSTIMDLSALGTKAIFVPTPGQTEQEYLADLMKKKMICNTYTQSKLSVQEALDNDVNYSGFKGSNKTSAYDNILDSFLTKLDLESKIQ